MTCRSWMAMFLLVSSLGVGLAAPIPVVKYEQPTMKFQVSNPAKLIKFIESASAVEGGRGGEGVNLLGESFKEMFNEKQMAKLTKGKPIGGALYLREKAEDTCFFIAVPFTSEKEGVAFLEGCKLHVEADKNNAGLSFLAPNGQEANEFCRIRFTGDVAFIGFNAKPEAFATNKLIPYSGIVDEKQTADIYVEANPALVPQDAIKHLTGVFDKGKQSVAQMRGAGNGMPLVFPDFATTWLEWMSRSLVAIQGEAESVNIAITIDEKSLNNTWKMTLKPKAKSELANSIAKHPACEGRFHQLLTDKIVAGKCLTLTGTPKDLGKYTVEMVMWQMDQGIKMIPLTPVHNLLQLASDQLKTQAAADKVDMAIVLNDANEKGLFSGIIALAVPDPSNLEKTWKAATADWTKEDKDLLKLDAEKIGEISIHTITYKDVPKSLAETFGKELVIRIGFGAKGMFLAMGPDGGKLIETAVELKAKPSRVIALDYHNGRIKTFASKLGMPVMELDELDRYFGKSEGKLPFLDLSVTTGEALVVTWKQNRLGILTFFAGMWFLF